MEVAISVIAKRLLRTRKEYGVSAEELKRANPFLEEEGLQIDRSSLSLQRLLPQESIEKHP
jgi:hypothetical protein